MSPKELDSIRGSELTMVFQDALAGLNPVFTVGNQLREEIRVHTGLSSKETAIRAEEMLDKMGIPDPHSSAKKYPYELSGGMRQRVMIAMALAC